MTGGSRSPFDRLESAEFFELLRIGDDEHDFAVSVSTSSNR